MRTLTLFAVIVAAMSVVFAEESTSFAHLEPEGGHPIQKSFASRGCGPGNALRRRANPRGRQPLEDGDGGQRVAVSRERCAGGGRALARAGPRGSQGQGVGAGGVGAHMAHGFARFPHR